MKEFFDLPENYGDNKIVLMVRDPWTIFAYWEIQDALEQSLKDRIREKGFNSQNYILRVYDTTNTNSPKVVSEISIEKYVKNWYINDIEPNASWKVAVGIKVETGDFFTLLESNEVRTPRSGMSDEVSDEWLCSKEHYYKVFAASGGYDVGKSSMELKEIISKHIKNWRFSGGLSSGMFQSIDWFKPK